MRELVKQFSLGNTKGKNQFSDAEETNAANFAVREAEFKDAGLVWCLVHVEKITENKERAMPFLTYFYSSNYHAKIAEKFFCFLLTNSKLETL